MRAPGPKNLKLFKFCAICVKYPEIKLLNLKASSGQNLRAGYSSALHMLLQTRNHTGPVWGCSEQLDEKTDAP